MYLQDWDSETRLWLARQPPPKKLNPRITVNIGEITYTAKDIFYLDLQRGMTRFARRTLWEFASERWIWSEVDKEFKDKRVIAQAEIATYMEEYWRLVAVLACMDEIFFDDMLEFWQLINDNPEKFDEMYNAAITANPKMPDYLKELEKEAEEQEKKNRQETHE